MAADAYDASNGISVPRKVIIVSDGVSGTRGSHCFMITYEVSLRGNTEVAAADVYEGIN